MPNITKIFSKKYCHLGRLAILVTLLASMMQPATAAVLFQDDTFHEIPSEALMIDSDGSGLADSAVQFGNDAVSTENGTINWNITTNTFEFDHSVDITGGLTANGDVDFSGSTELHLREVNNGAIGTPGTVACSTVGEVVVNLADSQMWVCTNAGTDTWQAASNSSSYLRSDTSDNFTSGTLTFDAGTTLDVNGTADFSGSTFIIASGTPNPVTCSEGQLFYNTATNELNVCTAANTWSNSGPQDLEDVYGTDADKVLTTGNGNFTINGGTGTFAVNNTGGVIDFNADSFTLDLTGGFSIDAVGASNMTTDSGNLTLATTTSGNVAVTAADDVAITAGDDVLFDDAQLSAPVLLTNTAAGWEATLTGGGIIDNINAFTLTTLGDGASNVGVHDAAGYYTGTDVESVLAELGAISGSNAANNGFLTFYPEYPDAVIFQDGTNNKGKLESDYDDTNDEHYYRWTTQKNSAQDIDLRFRCPVPADFSDVDDLTYKYRTGTAVEAQNDIEIGL